MSLYQFHRVLIAAAIVFDALFTFWAIRQWQTSGHDSLMLGMAIGSSVVTVTMITYLVYFNRNLTLLRHIVTGRCGRCGGDIRQALQDHVHECPACGAAIVRTAGQPAV